MSATDDKWKVLLLPGAILLLAALPGASADSSTGVEVLDVDDYDKTVDFGEIALFNWTLHHTNGAPTNYTVFINTSDADGG